MSAPSRHRRQTRLTSTGRAVVAGAIGLGVIAVTAGIADLMAASGAAATGAPIVLAADAAAATGEPEAHAAVAVPRPVATPPARPVRFTVTSLSVSDGQTYGVGMPVVVRFDRPIPAAARAQVQAAASVHASQPVGPASWSWPMDTMMAYRPKAFWPAETAVTVTLDLDERAVGMATKRRPLVGRGDRSATFRIGREQVTRVDLGSQTAAVSRDGRTVRWVAVSTGGPGFETRSGTKVILGREPGKVFTGDAFDEDYELVAKYALRVTDTGEYLHSAPWATGRLGRYAGSHGCTNMSDADGEWFDRTSLVGDPVVYSGDDDAPPMEPLNGLGGLWNIGWRQWVADSAAPPARTTVPIAA